jgi:lambda family phage portal protein
MNAERPDQYRGVTFLAPVIEKLLQINRYTEAESTAAIVQSFLTGFVTKNDDASTNPFNEVGAGFPEEEASHDPNEYEMGPGTMNYMEAGESITFTDPSHPSTGFDAFVNSIVTQIGAGLDLPKEILLKAFDSSYSASRAALLEAWKSFNMHRTWFINDFCNPVYELWLNEAVATGRIEAPGFLTDPATHEAWLGAEWIGPSQGQLDPVKEINAEIMACENGFSTHEDSALRLNGSEFTSNVEQLVREKELLKALAPEEVRNETKEVTDEPDEEAPESDEGSDLEKPDGTEGGTEDNSNE